MDKKIEFTEEQLQNITDFLNTLAHPLRLKIILQLSENPLSVTELMKALEVRQPNLSQHLSLLKRLRILKTKRKGRSVYYQLSHPEVKDLIENIANTIEKF
ncbi:MAG: transcriptional regulator [Dictyoglomus sp. NZ13-RE01]|nr:MAG: transcriptional regulator [Dictyoglomus sp. NZ13-RE01]